MIDAHGPASTNPLSLRHPTRHLFGALAVGVALVLLSVTAYRSATRESAEQLVAAERAARVEADARSRRRELVQCQRGNDVRSLERWRIRLDVIAGRLDAGTLRLVRLRFPILDCPETVALSRNVPLPPDAQLRIERAIVAQPKGAVGPDRTAG